MAVWAGWSSSSLPSTASRWRSAWTAPATRGGPGSPARPSKGSTRRATSRRRAGGPGVTGGAGGAGITGEPFEGIGWAIDCSAADAVAGNAERLAALRVPVVVGTTGWHDDLPRGRAAVERDGGGLLHRASLPRG